jgi:hypothetical protein
MTTPYFLVELSKAQLLYHEQKFDGLVRDLNPGPLAP